MSPLTGVHTWEFFIEEVSEGGKKVNDERVRCLHCKLRPTGGLAQKLYAQREEQLARERVARNLNKAQKDGTGTQISGRKKTA